MSLTEEQHSQIDSALRNVSLFELGRLNKEELTPLEKSLLNPKLYTREICPAYTEYTPHIGPLKNSGPIFIHLFNKTVSYGWMISRKRYFKNKIRENSSD